MTKLGSPQTKLLESLHNNASKHANESDDLFIVPPFDPNTLKRYQQIGHHSRRDTSNRRSVGSRIDPDILETLATIIDPRYENIKNMENTDSQNIAYGNIDTFLENNQNVALAQRHGEIRDIAFDLGNKSVKLTRMGRSHRTGLIVSKAVDFMHINTESFGFDTATVDMFLSGIGITADKNRHVPMRNFLGKVADYTYFVIPSTKTFKETRFHYRQLVKPFNNSTLSMLDNDLQYTGSISKNGSLEPMLLAVAPTGTTEKEVDLEKFKKGLAIEGNFKTHPKNIEIDNFKNVKVIGGIHPRTASYLGHCVTFASGIDLSEELCSSDIEPLFTFVSSKDDIPALEDRLARLSSRMDSDTLFIRDIKGNVPLLKKN